MEASEPVRGRRSVPEETVQSRAAGCAAAFLSDDGKALVRSVSDDSLRSERLSRRRARLGEAGDRCAPPPPSHFSGLPSSSSSPSLSRARPPRGPISVRLKENCARASRGVDAGEGLAEEAAEAGCESSFACTALAAAASRARLASTTSERSVCSLEHSDCVRPLSLSWGDGGGSYELS